MCAKAGERWGVPDFGVGVVRDRLLDRLDSFGRQPTVIVASAGAGKSFLAAQYAQRGSENAVWVDLDGIGPSVRAVWELVVARDSLSDSPGIDVRRAVSSDDAVALIVRAAQEQDSGRGVCLVLDNVGVSTDPVEYGTFLQLGKALLLAGIRLVVTTRSIDTWPAPSRCAWCILDEHDLALRGEEAGRLADLLGVALTDEEVDGVSAIASGHVSLCIALDLQAAKHGLDSRERVVSLQAWLELVLSELPEVDRRLVECAAALKVGEERDLVELDVLSPAQSMRRVASKLPLLQVAADGAGRVGFRVHDLIDGHFAERGLAPDTVARALGVLGSRGDYGRCCELLTRGGDVAASTQWLSEYGELAYSAGHIWPLDRLFACVAMSRLMSNARLLVLWSRVCGQMGRHEESLARARAARLVAEHERDWECVRGAIAQTLYALQSLFRHSEATALAEEIVSTTEDYVDDLLLAEALACIGACRSAWGDLHGAETSFEAVLEVCGHQHRPSVPAAYALNGLALLPCAVRGDWELSRRKLLELVDEYSRLPSNRIMLRGNLASCLMECGRIERCETLALAAVSEAEQYGLGSYVGSYSHVLAFCRFIQGDTFGALKQMREGIDRLVAENDVAQGAASRVWLSQVLRAIGRYPDSLAEAETAFETLSLRDELGFKRLAGYEVAASLLANDAPEAARVRIGALGAPDECENLFHRTAAVLTLAECDRREGCTEAALSRLAPLADYMCSESPNRLVALYARAFPNLLGLVALTVGVESLPVHMLRLIPPESAETILVETRAWLDDSVWRALGRRLLGSEEHDRFLARDGLPVCHVRFFGGLEVTVGGRSIRERDWRKRKARLLFAMLVSRRGHDVPREQLFEHLFADMDPERAKNNLYVSWSTMKSVLLGPAARGTELPYLETVGGVCRAVAENIRSDIDDFDKLLASAAKHEAAGDHGPALRDYEALSSLYRGELLPGDVYDDWFLELREYYRIAFVDAMLAASTILVDADDPGNALVFVRRAIQVDPLREDLYQAALKCQMAAGQRSGAIDTYVQCRSRLADDLGLDPSAETKALYEQILAMEEKPRVTPLDPFGD